MLASLIIASVRLEKKSYAQYRWKWCRYKLRNM